MISYNILKYFFKFINPWRYFTYSPTMDNVLHRDCQFIKSYTAFLNSNKKYKGNDKNKLHLELFPEPFAGSPCAPIYLLGGNPGYNSEDVNWCNSSKACSKDYILLMKKNLRHISSSFVFFDKKLKGYGGFKWWSQHIDDEMKDRIFNIEYFPYHTQKADGLKEFLDTNPKVKCGSNRYTDHLIHVAMNDGKVIIITRFERFWLSRIQSLKDYKNLYVLLNYQSARVKQDNIVKYEEFQFLKQDSWTNIKQIL